MIELSDIRPKSSVNKTAQVANISGGDDRFFFNLADHERLRR